MTGPGCANVDWYFQDPVSAVRQFVFRTPTGKPRKERFHLGGGRMKGEMVFEAASLRPVKAVWNTQGGVTLGHGEAVDGNSYSFTSQMNSAGRNDSRTLLSHTAGYNTQRWCVSGGQHVTYRLALEGRADRRVCDLEVRREGRSYTCETLEELCRLYPDSAFTFLVGGDCLCEFSRWREPERILACAHLAAVSREGKDLARLQKEAKKLSRRFGGEVTVLPLPAIELSSTMLRERAKKGLSLRYLTPEKVEAYIAENGLYR